MEPVYFVPLNNDTSIEAEIQAMQKLLYAARMERIISTNDFVAVKIHVGEVHNTTHIKPELIKVIVEYSHQRTPNVFLTETSTLYMGERENAVKHILHAERHGFGISRTGAPMIMADGLTGTSEIEVEIQGELEKYVKVARDITFADTLITVSHPTGHPFVGLAACLKNLGMGLSSRSGKLRQHSSVKPTINKERCLLCRKCIRWCPNHAITEKQKTAEIDPEYCHGCGECYALCRHHAIDYNWGNESALVQKSVAEHAYGVIKDKRDKCFFINVLVDMTAVCDCLAEQQTKLIPDIGILGSYDPIAIDKATLDLTAQFNKQSLSQLSNSHLDPMIQLNHGVKIGMGTLNYQLITI